MRRFLIHTNNIGGHQLEYIHHLYLGALSRKEDKFIFLLPERFLTDSKTLEWPQSDNISIEIMDSSEVPPKNCNIIKKSYLLSKVVKHYCEKHAITDVVTISIMQYLPLIPFFLKNVRFSGIIYGIYLYEWKKENWLQRLLDVTKYWIMSRCRIFHRVFILNDSASACYLQRLYHTNKFCYLPDPVASPLNYHPKNVRFEIGIEREKKIVLHAGGMTPYKGTINILKALEGMNKEECGDFAVVFAGQIDKIQSEFEYYFKRIEKKGITIKLIAGFLPFEELADLFYTSDFVLLPYNESSRSSGIVGHAAFYEKPVAVVKGGVIGKVVKRWRLGYTIENNSPNEIQRFLRSLPEYTFMSNDYLDSHTMKVFYDIILK